MIKHNSKIQPNSSVNPKVTHSVLSVERVISDLKLGRCVLINHKNTSGIIIQATETITKKNLLEMTQLSQNNKFVAITSSRANSLGCNLKHKTILKIKCNTDTNITQIHALANPLIKRKIIIRDFETNQIRAKNHIAAGIELTKIACLLPSITFFYLENTVLKSIKKWCADHQILSVNTSQVFKYHHKVTLTLQKVCETRIPIKNNVKLKLQLSISFLLAFSINGFS